MTIKSSVVLTTSILLTSFAMTNQPIMASDDDNSDGSSPDRRVSLPKKLESAAAEAYERSNRALEISRTSPDASTKNSAARIAAAESLKAKKLEDEVKKVREYEATVGEIQALSELAAAAKIVVVEERKLQRLEKPEASKRAKKGQNHALALIAKEETVKAKAVIAAQNSDKLAETKRKKEERERLRSILAEKNKYDPRLVRPTAEEAIRSVVAAQGLAKKKKEPRPAGLDHYGRPIPPRIPLQ